MANLLQVLDPVTVKASSSALEGIVACIDRGQVGVRLTGSSVGKGSFTGTMGDFQISNNNGIYTNMAGVTKRRLTRLEELRLRRELGISKQQNETKRSNRGASKIASPKPLAATKPTNIPTPSTTRTSIAQSSSLPPSMTTPPLKNASIDPPESSHALPSADTSFDDVSTVISVASAKSSLSLSQVKEKISRSSPTKKESTQERLAKLRNQQKSKSDPPGVTSKSLFVGGLHSWAGMAATKPPSPTTTSTPPSPPARQMKQNEEDAEGDGPEGFFFSEELSFDDDVAMSETSHKGQEVTELSFYLNRNALNESDIASVASTVASEYVEHQEQVAMGEEPSPSSPQRQQEEGATVEQVLDPWDRILLQSQGIIEAETPRPPPVPQEPVANVVDPWDLILKQQQQQAAAANEVKLQESQQAQEIDTTVEASSPQASTPFLEKGNIAAASPSDKEEETGREINVQSSLDREHEDAGKLHRTWNRSDSGARETKQQRDKKLQNEEHREEAKSVLRQSPPWKNFIPWGLRLQGSEEKNDSSVGGTSNKKTLTNPQYRATPQREPVAVLANKEIDENSPNAPNKENAAPLRQPLQEANKFPPKKEVMQSRAPLGSQLKEDEATEASTVESDGDRGGDEVSESSTGDKEQEEQYHLQYVNQPLSFNSSFGTKLSLEVSSQGEKKEDLDDGRRNSNGGSLSSLHSLSSGISDSPDRVLNRSPDPLDREDAAEQQLSVPVRSSFSSLRPLPIAAERPSLKVAHPWDKVLDRLTDGSEDDKEVAKRNVARTPADKAFYATLKSPEMVIFVDESTSTTSSVKVATTHGAKILDIDDDTASQASVDTKSRMALGEDLQPDSKAKAFLFTDDVDIGNDQNDISPTSVLKEALMLHGQLSACGTPTASDNDSYSTSSLPRPPSTPSSIIGDDEDALLFRLDETAITVDRTGDGLDFTSSLPLMTAINGNDTLPSLAHSYTKVYMSEQREKSVFHQVTKSKNQVSTPTRPNNLQSPTKSLLAQPSIGGDSLYQDPYMASAPKPLDESTEANNFAHVLQAAAVEHHGEYFDDVTTVMSTKASERSPGVINFGVSPESMIMQERHMHGSSINGSVHYIEKSFASYCWNVPSSTPPGNKIEGKQLFHQHEFDVESPPSPAMEESLHSLDSYPNEEARRSILQIDMSGQITEVSTSVKEDWQPSRSWSPGENAAVSPARRSSDSNSIIGEETAVRTHDGRTSKRCHKSTPRKKCCLRWLIALAGIAIGAAVALIYGLGYIDFDTKTSASVSPENETGKSISPTPSPSIQAEKEKILMMAAQLGVLDEWQETPYMQVTLEWMTQDGVYAYHMNLTPREMEERFSLVALYMATTSEGTGNDNDWTLDYGFLSPKTSVCEWNEDGQGVFCNEFGLVTEINVSKFKPAFSLCLWNSNH